MEETLSVEEAGRRLGIGRSVAYRLAAEGRIPVLRLGKKLRVPRRALERMLEYPQESQRHREAAR